MKKVFGCLFQCHFFVEFLEVNVMIFFFASVCFKGNEMKFFFKENLEITVFLHELMFSSI